jgi:hypothetical protein
VEGSPGCASARRDAGASDGAAVTLAISSERARCRQPQRLRQVGHVRAGTAAPTKAVELTTFALVTSTGPTATGPTAITLARTKHDRAASPQRQPTSMCLATLVGGEK